MTSFFSARRFDAHNIVLLFLIAAVTSVLGTRLFLTLTGYPQLSAGRLHISHALDGGLFMLFGILIMNCLYGKRALYGGTIVAGLGFGRFLDEIGKYMTRDNNYFFQPAVVLIYITFICLYYLYRYIQHNSPESERSLYYHILENLDDIADENFTKRDRRRLFLLIKRLKKSRKRAYAMLASTLETYVSSIPLQTEKIESRAGKVVTHIVSFFDTYAPHKAIVFRSILALLIIYTVSGMVSSLGLLSLVLYRQGFVSTLRFQSEGFFFISQSISQAVSGFFLLRGFFLLHKDKRNALEHFKIGLTINIFITHLFTFYIEQFSASVGLFVSILAYLVLESIIEHEETEDEFKE